MNLAALILSIAKAVPAVERLLGEVTALYTAWKVQQNNEARDAKDARNDAAIDAAVRGVSDGGTPPPGHGG